MNEMKEQAESQLDVARFEPCLAPWIRPELRRMAAGSAESGPNPTVEFTVSS